jgi:DMSO/TMAO reductase YedYZ molybdopterin-dependent catalytic subunit
MPERAKRPSLGARFGDALRRAAEAAAERPEATRESTRGALASRSRRDFVLFGIGVLATAGVGWWLLPERAKRTWLPGSADRLDTLAARVGLTRMQREAQLNRVLTFDDDVAEALFSNQRRVRTYDRPDPRPLRNNYHGRTPDPDYLAGWRLNLTGLASGRDESLAIDELRARFARHDMNTRLVCVEGWSHVVAWGGVRFADLLAAYPPAPGMRWAALRSGVSLDGAGNPEPYYVSIDLETARHPQALLATHHAGAPLTLAHGAPLRLVVPMKLGLKNIKAITSIAYSAAQPGDYWGERGYSRYDGL